MAFDITTLHAADMGRFAAAVTPERRTRAARFRFIEDQQRCLAAGVLLRYALTRNAGVSWNDVEFGKNEFGKPFLVRPAGVHFNLAHAGNWVVCATSATEIGIDIERAAAGHLEIAHRLAPPEYSYVMAAPAIERPRRFAQVWTLKEGYLKYLGKGLNVAMDAFSVTPEHRHPLILRGDLDSSPLLKQVAHDANYYLAECSADDSEIRIEQPGLDALMAAR